MVWGKGRLTPRQVSRARAAYYSLVSYVDGLLGEVLAALDASPFASSTVVAFIADHGNLLGEHDLFQKCSFYEPVVRVPFMIRVPGQAARSVGAPADPLYGPDGVLYNLADDPGELHNRYYDPSCRGEVERLMDALDRFTADHSSRAPGPLVPTEP